MEVPTINLSARVKFFHEMRDQRIYRRKVKNNPDWPKIENVHLDRAIHIGSKVIHRIEGPGVITHFSMQGKIHVWFKGRHSQLVEGSDLRWAQD